MKTIYLCGGIKDLSIKEQTEWRDIATKKLQLKFLILNPMRRNFRDCEFESQNEITSLDKKDIIDSDILLVNGTKPSWGTAMEIMFAFERHKIIVIFTGVKLKDETNSPWITFHATKCVETLDDAIKYIKKMFDEKIMNKNQTMLNEFIK